MHQRTIAYLIPRLSVPEHRPALLKEIARHCASQEMVVFAPDPDTGNPRPILGTPQTLPRTKEWGEILRSIRKPGEWRVRVAPSSRRETDAYIWAGSDGKALVLIGRPTKDHITTLVDDFRLAFELFRMEFVNANADAACEVTRELSARNEQILKALEQARIQLATKSQRLQDANQNLQKERETAERFANIDSLTGLASRRAFERELESVVEECSTFGSEAWLITIDLDGFKEINDTRGHATGDRVLEAVGDSIRRCCCSGVFAGRLGGDEFAIIARIAGQDAALALATMMQEEIRKPFLSREEILSVRCTVGLACLPRDAVTAEELMRKADAGLYSAKRTKKGDIGRYTEEIEFVLDEHRQAINFLLHALEHNWVIPYYQPKVKLSDTSIAGFEALARVRDANGKIHSPGRFWHALSEQECVRRLGRRMMELVTQDLVTCHAIGAPRRGVSVNIAGPEISSYESIKLILQIVNDAAIEKGLLEVEITETAFVSQELDKVGENIKLLTKEGLCVALDDFGTGFSSLSHLLKWEPDCIKIDKSFVQGISNSRRCTKIVHSIVELGRTLDITVVAEGVETKSQAEFLLAIGCPQAQGYLFGRPAAAEETLLANPLKLYAK